MPQQLGESKRRDKRADLRLAVAVAAAKRLLGVMLFVSVTWIVTWLQVMAAQTQTQYVKRHGVEKDLHKNCLGFEDCPYERRETGEARSQTLYIVRPESWPLFTDTYKNNTAAWGLLDCPNITKRVKEEDSQLLLIPASDSMYCGSDL
jgi:hypothetical protein